jgi:hypothetical protein
MRFLARFALGRAIWIRVHASPRFSGAEVARRALSRVGEDRYRLLTNNYEWCVQACKTSNAAFRSSAC